MKSEDFEGTQKEFGESYEVKALEKKEMCGMHAYDMLVQDFTANAATAAAEPVQGESQEMVGEAFAKHGVKEYMPSDLFAKRLAEQIVMLQAVLPELSEKSQGEVKMNIGTIVKQIEALRAASLVGRPGETRGAAAMGEGGFG